MARSDVKIDDHYSHLYLFGINEEEARRDIQNLSEIKCRKHI